MAADPHARTGAGSAGSPAGASSDGSSALPAGAHAPAAPPHPKLSLSVYFTAARLRTDAWERLKTTTYRLAAAIERGKDARPLKKEVVEILETLDPLETYYAFPGRAAVHDLRALLEDEDYDPLFRRTAGIVRMLVSHSYRRHVSAAAALAGLEAHEHKAVDEAGAAAGSAVAAARRADDTQAPEPDAPTRPYFEVLIVDALSPREEAELRESLRLLRSEEDEFVYDVVIVQSFEDALIAVLLNYTLQSCVIRYGFPFESRNRISLLRRTLHGIDRDRFDRMTDGEVGIVLGRAIHQLRPPLDLFLVTDAPVEDLAGQHKGTFRRVFYRQEDYRELHLSLLKGIRERYRTPFFGALKAYAQKPTGVFHALPVSRGKSVSRSHWIRDLERFYGSNLFIAETSATTGGLDSLLQPHGSLREAQELAARAFGSRRSFFVTNGTSTANKIVLQALVRPGDLVLVSRDCHQSHHYALQLTGAHPVYMDPYPVARYAMYGAVPLRDIKRHLLALRRAGALDRVKVLLLTNCTFDGLVYNPERIMEEVLAIKPDMTFIWDEAWFAFACFAPITRRRTAMAAASRLRERLRSPEYRARYERWRAETGPLEDDDGPWLDAHLLPDPDAAKVRVYATQSTHKTLTSLRQGSMIHVADVEFERRVHDAFHQAYLTHTSTSANYQILASLDVGRRQVELEGYELVQRANELALSLRERVNSHPLLTRFFRMLTAEDLIPEAFRPSGFQGYRELHTNWARMDRAWEEDEFCVDPTRLTLWVGLTGMDGDTFKRRLMEGFDIQINKTSRNTVLFMTHIGTTRGSTAHLIDVLTRIAEDLLERREEEGDRDRVIREGQVTSLTEGMPPLPGSCPFHRAFRPGLERGTLEGDLRGAFFKAADEGSVEYLKLDGTIEAALASGREVVAATFVTPYPPGFPLLVPGQMVTPDVLAYLKALDVREIHGYEPAYGMRVFTRDGLRAAEDERRTAVAVAAAMAAAARARAEVETGAGEGSAL